MFRNVSVKKLFFLLLAAIIALLLLFFLHGPFLDEGVEDAVVQALLERAGTGEEGIPAEGHKIFQVTMSEDAMQVWGVFRTGVYRLEGGVPELTAVSDTVPAEMVFIKEGETWILAEYLEPGASGKDMREIFPWHLRPFAAMKGWFENGLSKQMETYAGT